jgi:rare lipoprotein A (peptidoglycan hydrolase)
MNDTSNDMYTCLDEPAIEILETSLEDQLRRTYIEHEQKYIDSLRTSPHRNEGAVSWYGKQFHGKKTANGEVFDTLQSTAAHATLPLPTMIEVFLVDKQGNIHDSEIVRVNDRGPYEKLRYKKDNGKRFLVPHKDRVLDLSTQAYRNLFKTKKPYQHKDYHVLFKIVFH